MKYIITSTTMSTQTSSVYILEKSCNLLCIMQTHIFGPNFKEKYICFDFLIQLFIYI